MKKFNFDQAHPELKWMNQPKVVKYSKEDKKGLQVTPDKNSDFWQKTYYDPPLLADNGHLLYQEVGTKVMAETSFNIDKAGQFDQAGLMVRKDTNCWIKTGLEYVDGNFKLSCVVTNNYSDWSTQNHASGKLAIRIYRIGASFVIEAKSETVPEWDFIRICHLNIGEDEPIKMGTFFCSPKEEGSSITFDYLNYEKFDKYHHSAE